MNIGPFLLHSVYLLQIMFLIIPISQSLSKFCLLLILLFLFLTSILQESKYSKWSLRALYSNGIVFLSYYLLMISFGFIYGYAFRYTATNIFLLLPLFYFLLVPKNLNVQSLLNIVLFYAFISMAFSYLELFAWDKIGFLNDYVNSSLNEKGFSNIYRPETGLKIFGIYPNAVRNGLMMIFGCVILLERMYMKFRWHYFVSLLLFVIAIYFTYTRNNYLTLFFALFIWYVISKKSRAKIGDSVWFLSVGFYVIVLFAAFLIGYNEGSGSFSIYSFTGESSIQSRVISWVTIFHDYFLKDFFSFHTFFGYGLTQFENALSPENTYWLIDNSILMIYLGSGLIGIFLFLSWLKSALNILSINYIRCDGVICSHVKILMVMLMVHFINGVINASILDYTLLLPLLMMLSKYTRMKYV